MPGPVSDDHPLAASHASSSLNFRAPSEEGFVPSIEELKAIQTVYGWGDRHIVWVGPLRFVMAHTDAERASGMDLEDCAVHYWFSHAERPPMKIGYYTVEGECDHEHQPEPDDDIGWKFTPFDPVEDHE
jgi:hypothetical protein